MGDLPEITRDGRSAIVITVPPHWCDHHFQGRAVLPAVEAMQLLAHWARRIRPQSPVADIRAAAFDKFLELPPAGERLEAWYQFKELPGDILQGALMTKTRAKTSGMTRTKIHAQAEFHPSSTGFGPAALDLAAALDGVCFSVDPADLYRELVPFGPGFQTISGPLRLTREGALAVIRAPELRDGQTDQPLGSPFVADGAFHAACVWSQRFAGIVAFPVGIDHRRIIMSTRPGETYAARIFPVRTGDLLSFDIWIVDMEGNPCEMLQGVHMRDVSGGHLLPPDWIRGADEDGLDRLAEHCKGMVLIERATLMPFAGRCLSHDEAAKTARMAPKRLTDYVSSRLACKRLVRRLSGDRQIPADAITTLSDDGVRPVCPAIGASAAYHCSVAHDSCYTVAVAARQPVGIDVEPLAERILKSLRIFMDDEEQAAVHTSDLGAAGAALRVWTIKEAVAKMLDIHLADAWKRCRVLAVGAVHSEIRIESGPPAVVIHHVLNGHMITLAHPVGSA